MKKSVSVFLLALCGTVFAQGVLTYNGNHNYTLVERTNLRRYDNDKYTGLMSREVRSFITCENNRNGDIYYSGDFYVSQDTVRAQKVLFTGIHEAIPSSFIINERGTLTMQVDNGYPSFRSFPSFPRDPVKIGDTWKGDSFRAIDPLNNGIITKIPMTVLYKLLGEEMYKDEPVYRISAEWATRYGISYWDFGGDKDLKSAQGSHKAVVLVSKRTGAMVFMTDTVDETFVYADGKKVGYKGSILLFTKYPPSTDYDKILPALKRIGAVAKADKSGSGKSDGKIDTSKKNSANIKTVDKNIASASGSKNDATDKKSSDKNVDSSGSRKNGVTDKKSGDKIASSTGAGNNTNDKKSNDKNADSSGSKNDVTDKKSGDKIASSTGAGNNTNDKKSNDKNADSSGSKNDVTDKKSGDKIAALTGGDTSGIADKKSDEVDSSTISDTGDASNKKSDDNNVKQKIAEVVPVQKDDDDLGQNKITVEETNAGIKLSIHDLKFKADSSELLSGEEKRLNEIAEILKLVPDSMLLVEGHTADTGNPRGEMNLSKERAFKIADELAKRGINPDKFICKGSGATKPIADNSTSAGKAKNRRVEITILE